MLFPLSCIHKHMDKISHYPVPLQALSALVVKKKLASALTDVALLVGRCPTK